MREIVFHAQAWEDFTYWAAADKKMLRRLLRLIEEGRRTPFEGAGKPEPLRTPASASACAGVSQRAKDGEGWHPSPD